MPRDKKRQKIARDATAAHAPSQKIDRETTAAYAASQPLFDALRNGAANIDSQRDNLTKARDAVQQVHVKVATEDAPSHEQYMENIVEAWQSATTIFCQVFSELTSITAAEPSEGREAGKAHGQFMSMLDTAQKARDVANAYAPPGTANSEGAGKAATVESDDEEEEEVVSPPTKAKLEIKTTTSALPNGNSKRTFEQLKTDALPPTPATNGHRPARSARRRSWKKANEAAKSTEESQSKGSANGQADTKPAPEVTSNPQPAVKFEDLSHQVEARIKSKLQPAVEFEDVSHLVEARIKAKAEKAAEKKKSKLKLEKKRKRESGDSFAAMAEEKDHEPIKTEVTVEKPKRKKSKKVAPGVDDTLKNADKVKHKEKSADRKADVKHETHTVLKDKLEKRKTEVEQVEEGEKPAGKKRKKNKD
ncbi:hypothetical protein TI39_contig438g00015 [Zymoseptoria brevis]|uniref:Uncharacterized protein n=1 Tax=Zymoseptoria brevis TaxID=1047168 RepID=A0A0F4GLY4_9PEZI|nr:hypothetical protein TI39_contig438g00015 [Zymoseptoria brevis]